MRKIKGKLLKKAADTDKAAAETKLKALETQMETLKFQSVKVKLKSVKSNAKKTAKVTVRKVDGAEKYQITYSTKSNFKKAETQVNSRVNTWTDKRFQKRIAPPKFHPLVSYSAISFNSRQKAGV